MFRGGLQVRLLTDGMKDCRERIRRINICSIYKDIFASFTCANLYHTSDQGSSL